MVAHDAFEMTLCLPGSNIFSFTPMQIGEHRLLDGAEMMTAPRPCADAATLCPRRESSRRSTTNLHAEIAPRISAGSGFEKTRSWRRRSSGRCRYEKSDFENGSVYRVVLQQIARLAAFGEIVHRHEFNIEFSGQRGANNIASDAPESVDANLDHEVSVSTG